MLQVAAVCAMRMLPSWLLLQQHGDVEQVKSTSRACSMIICMPGSFV